jgi:hypothetical protein
MVKMVPRFVRSCEDSLIVNPMNVDRAKDIFSDWIATQQLKDIPLLDVELDQVTAKFPQKGARLMCSERLVNRIRELRTAIHDDWHGQRLIEGMLYLIYRRTNGSVYPIYAGKSASAGKTGKTMNSLYNYNYKGGRFCDSPNCGGHIDLINKTLLGKSSGYKKWVQTLFEPGVSLNPNRLCVKMRAPIYVHAELWNTESSPMIPALVPIVGHLSLAAEEAIRIWLLKSAGYGALLLNREGN